MSLPYENVIYFIQNELANGRQPNSDGFYIFSRKELSEGADISPSTFDTYKQNVIDYFAKWCDLKRWAKYEEYPGEILYVDVSFERGKLKFRQNPLTINSALSQLWALPPLEKYFVFDSFDDKHRRRCNGSTPKKDAIPWSWDADLHEKLVANGEIEKVKAQFDALKDDDILVQQAKKVCAEYDVALVLCGYQPNTLSKDLYSAVGYDLPELSEFLLSNGANPNEIIQNGYSSMDHISGWNRGGDAWEKIIRMLLEHGGDLTVNKFTFAVFSEAVFTLGSKELCIRYVDEVKKRNLINYVSSTGQTLLSCAKNCPRSDGIVEYIQAQMESLDV